MDRREKIARLAQSKEDEVLLARVYERITLAAQRNVPASTCFLSKREQMLCQELLRGEDFRFFWRDGAFRARGLLLSAGVFGRELAVFRRRSHCRRARKLF